MKHYLFLAATALLLSGYAANAQDIKEEGNTINKERNRSNDRRNNNNNDNKLDEYEEIIIKRKGEKDDKDTKITIEIKGEDVFIDGKPIDVYVNEDVSVKLRDVNRYKLSPDASQFRFKSGDWDMGGDMDGGPEKPFLGVMTEGTTQGARIEKLSENGAAAKAGLKEGDVITKVNDKNVFDHEQLSDVISQLKPEEKVTITYTRDGKENKTTATLGKRKASLSRAFHYAPNDLGPMPPLAFDFDGYNPGDLGNLLELRNRPRLGIKAQDTEDGSGVKILGVDEDSPADKAGVKENDIITSFDGKKVTNADELAKASRESKDKASIKIDVNRNGKAQTLEVKVPKKLKTANL